MSDDIERLKALAAAATPGPWTVCDEFRPGISVDAQSVGLCEMWLRGNREQHLSDAAYIAACDPATISRLIARLEQAEADARRWRGVEEYLIAAVDGSMSRNNSQNLAAELLDQIRAAMKDHK